MPDTQTLPVKEKEGATKKKYAPLWKVLFHNDNKTSMEFVTWVLMRFYALDSEKAYAVMMEIHKTGIGLAGTYSQEVAELKMEQTVSAARTRKFPLKVTIEPAE